MNIQDKIDLLGSHIKELVQIVRRKEKERLRLLLERDQEYFNNLLTDKPKLYLVGKL